MQLEEILTIPQVAERLHVDVSTVWRLVKRGAFDRVVRLTGHKSTRIPAGSVQKFVASRTIKMEARP